MKCAVCGKEFGNGAICQNCGIDRVTGLANYRSYHNPEGDKNYSSYDRECSSPKTMVCFACGEIIPSNSKFCPYCSKQLYVTCPKCGNTYSSQFPACNKCGTNMEIYYAETAQKEEEYAKQIKDAEENKLVNKILAFIFVPFFSVMWWFFITKGLPEWGVQIPEVWPNTFPTNIILYLILGYITYYIITYFDSDR